MYLPISMIFIAEFWWQKGHFVSHQRVVCDNLTHSDFNLNYIHKIVNISMGINSAWETTFFFCSCKITIIISIYILKYA